MGFFPFSEGFYLFRQGGKYGACYYLIMLVCWLFLFGLVVGSFLNVVIDRVPRQEKITGRSHCDFCQRQLSWRELLPLISFVCQKAQSKCCHHRLSWQYPLVEVATGILFVVLWRQADLLLLPLAAGLLALLVIDLKTMLLPQTLTYPLLILALVRLVILPDLNLGLTLLGALGVGLFFYSIIVITKGRGMGQGDVTLGVLVSLIASWPYLVTSLFVANLLGGVVAWLLLLLGVKKKSDKLPFGPFLIIGLALTLLNGEWLMALLFPLW